MMSRTPLPAFEVVTDPDQAAAVLHPDRRRVLEALREPGSATTVGERLDLPRQRVNYHLRELERVGLVKLVETRRKRNCTERLVQATATSYVLSPDVLAGRTGQATDTPDRFSSAYLVSLAVRLIRELGELRRRARDQGKRLATLALQTDIRFASPAERAAFAEELADTIARLVSEYDRPDDPDARPFRILVGAHPAPDTTTEPTGAADDRQNDA